jgi:SAM-dependent methyltransferase
MKYRLFDFIQCPHCKKAFDLQVFKNENKKYDKIDGLSDINSCPSHCKNPDPAIMKKEDIQGHCKKCYESEITEGLLSCSCGKVYPIVRGVPRFLPDAFDQHPDFTEKYFSDIKKHVNAVSDKDKEYFRKMFKDTQATFGLQWKTWGKSDRIYGLTDDENREWFLRDLTSTDIDASYFSGKTVLEVGCGHGRFVKVLNGLCSEYFALDLGPSVDLAREITKDRPTVHIMQANAMYPPLKDESFDYVWSHGVLHHTPSTRQAFDAVARLPRKATGWLYIWVYHKGGFIWEYGNRFVRSITTRMPKKLLHYIAYSLVPLLYIIPAYNKDVNLSHMSWSACALSVNDWLAPKYQWHHSVEEVKSWFKEQGFKDIEKTSANGVGITGVRNNSS